MGFHNFIMKKQSVLVLLLNPFSVLYASKRDEQIFVSHFLYVASPHLSSSIGSEKFAKSSEII